MELFLFRHAEYERLYNCTGIDIEKEPLENRRFVVESVIITILCAIYYILYIPCMISIWKHLGDSVCYQILFYVGITDLAILWLPGFLSAWLSLEGAVFCSHPTLIYVTGAFVFSLWIAESSADFILAINRCLSMASPKLSDFFFKGWRTTAWLVACSLYALYGFLFKMPALFTGLHFAWFFDPFIGYRPDPEAQFGNSMHYNHNNVMAILYPVTYVLFLGTFWLKFRAFKSSASMSGQQGGGSMFTSAEKRLFFQVFVISLLNSIACIICAMFNFVPVTQALITLGEFAWFHVHGFPPVIYLTMNQTIRADSIRLFYKLFLPHRVTKVHGVTVIMVKPPPPAVAGTVPRAGAVEGPKFVPHRQPLPPNRSV